MLSTTFGRKGGEGPTRGRRKVRYEIRLPNGEVVTKGSFNVDQPTAWAEIYEHEGVWYVAGIYAKITDHRWHMDKSRIFWTAVRKEVA